MDSTTTSIRRRWMLAAIPAAALSLWADPSHAALCGDRCDSVVTDWNAFAHEVPAIRLAAEDGNARTEADATWVSLLPTPPVQDHSPTHSTLGAAAAAVLAHGFGRDCIRFEFASPTALPEQPTRSITSFSAVAKENAESRVRAGIHFRSSVDQGPRLGERIGEFAIKEVLRVVD